MLLISLETCLWEKSDNARCQHFLFEVLISLAVEVVILLLLLFLIVVDVSIRTRKDSWMGVKVIVYKFLREVYKCAHTHAHRVTGGQEKIRSGTCIKPFGQAASDPNAMEVESHACFFLALLTS